MSDRRSVPAWVVVLALAVAALGAAAAVWAFFRWLRPDLVAVPSVDLDRLSGSWRSIAALPVAERDTGQGMALRIHHEGGGAHARRAVHSLRRFGCRFRGDDQCVVGGAGKG